MGPKIKDVLRGWLKLVRERESEREKKKWGEREGRVNQWPCSGI